MNRFIAIAGTIAIVLLAAPAGRASPLSPDTAVEVPADQELAYMKKGGKGWKHGKKVKWRGGPPPWAPAHGLRRKRGW
jgi:hypothetical protein